MSLKTLKTIILLSYPFLCSVSTASPIGPGVDLYMTQSALFNLSGLELGLGSITLVGYPPEPMAPANTDTVMRRTSSLSSGETGKIDIEIVSMSLKGTDPVEIDPDDLPPLIPPLFPIDSFFDVFVELDPLAIPIIGEIEVTEHDDSNFDFLFEGSNPVIYAFMVTFRNVDDPSIMFTEEIVDTVNFGSVPWSHTPAEFYPTIPNHGGFYPTIPNHPLTITGTLFTQTLVAARIPEPNNLMLLLLGFGIFCFKHNKRCRLAGNPNIKFDEFQSIHKKYATCMYK